MSRMAEKVAYLKGLAEGLGVSGDSDQGKLMLAVIDALEAFAQESGETCEKLDELEQYVEEIDSDVSDLEEALFSEDDEDDAPNRQDDVEQILRGSRPADKEENAKDDEENRVEHIGWNRFLFGHNNLLKKSKTHVI